MPACTMSDLHVVDGPAIHHGDRPAIHDLQLVMNSWEKDAFRQRQRAELGADTKRKGESTSTIPIKRTRAEAPSIPDKATVGECGTH